mmetsp:Transcript_125119/g.286677  ORF Transcript_125119/g.286677 Transcript_125119/m.286677 type:complete len:351 (-) Transcript_125119:90-1142(-)
MRLARLVRLLNIFQELTILLATLGKCFKAVFWITVILVAIIYGGSCATTALLGQPFQDDVKIEVYFATMARSMFTHFEVITTENWFKIADASAAHGKVWTWYWVVFLVLCHFAILNLLGGLITERILSTSQNDENEFGVFLTQSDFFKRTMGDIFLTGGIGLDSSLPLDIALEVMSQPDNQVILEAFGINTHVPNDVLVAIVDPNGDDQVTLQEFIEACLRLRGTETSLHTLFLHSDVNRGFAEVNKDADRLSRVMETYVQRTARADNLQAAASRDEMRREVVASTQRQASEMITAEELTERMNHLDMLQEETLRVLQQLRIPARPPSPSFSRAAKSGVRAVAPSAFSPS